MLLFVSIGLFVVSDDIFSLLKGGDTFRNRYWFRCNDAAVGYCHDVAIDKSYFFLSILQILLLLLAPCVQGDVADVGFPENQRRKNSAAPQEKDTICFLVKFTCN